MNSKFSALQTFRTPVLGQTLQGKGFSVFLCSFSPVPPPQHTPKKFVFNHYICILDLYDGVSIL